MIYTVLCECIISSPLPVGVVCCPFVPAEGVSLRQFLSFQPPLTFASLILKKKTLTITIWTNPLICSTVFCHLPAVRPCLLLCWVCQTGQGVPSVPCPHHSQSQADTSCSTTDRGICSRDITSCRKLLCIFFFYFLCFHKCIHKLFMFFKVVTVFKICIPSFISKV